MSQISMLARVTEHLHLNAKLHAQTMAQNKLEHGSSPISGFGSWLDSLNDMATKGTDRAALASLSPRSIWYAGDIPSPTYERPMTHDEPLSGDDGWTVVHSNCELVHPRPRMFWVLAYQNVCDMEAQAASLAKERERELRAMNPPGEVQFQRSDDDEIVVLPKRRRASGYDWAAAIAVLPRSSKSSAHPSPTGSN